MIFYEPVPSAIRSIQRRGRTGRSSDGHVMIFVTRGTKDEVSLCTSVKKEASMKRSIIKVKRELEVHGGPVGP